MVADLALVGVRHLGDRRAVAVGLGERRAGGVGRVVEHDEHLDVEALGARGRAASRRLRNDSPAITPSACAVRIAVTVSHDAPRPAVRRRTAPARSGPAARRQQVAGGEVVALRVGVGDDPVEPVEAGLEVAAVGVVLAGRSGAVRTAASDISLPSVVPYFDSSCQPSCAARDDHPPRTEAAHHVEQAEQPTGLGEARPRHGEVDRHRPVVEVRRRRVVGGRDDDGRVGLERPAARPPRPRARARASPPGTTTTVSARTSPSSRRTSSARAVGISIGCVWGGQLTHRSRGVCAISGSIAAALATRSAHPVGLQSRPAWPRPASPPPRASWSG